MNLDAITEVPPGSFEIERHYYERVLNAQLHPLVRHFLALQNDRIAARYAHLHPESDRHAIDALLQGKPQHFLWGGADLFVVTSEKGGRRIVVIETNSCPSGQKSFPLRDDADEQGGYRVLLEGAFLPELQRRRLPSGRLAVLFDKNPMEASGYAATLAELTQETVLLVPCHRGLEAPLHSIDDGVLFAHLGGERLPIRAALRYVTQSPWDRIAPILKTFLLNPTVVCLAGGRNKAVAAKAYDLFNAHHGEDGLQIRTPETIWDVSRAEVPLWVDRMGGVAVVKNPYSNAGQGVYTITCEAELERFMKSEQRYDRFIVQALIGNYRWSSRSRQGRWYHVGTVPNKHGQIFAADLRMMIGCGPAGYFPVALYARRARTPLEADIDQAAASWEMLGTNLSIRKAEGDWSTQTERLLLVDNRDFNKLGIGLDDLIEAYLQTVMAMSAIDGMAQRLLTQKHVFRTRFFQELNPDQALADEILK